VLKSSLSFLKLGFPPPPPCPRRYTFFVALQRSVLPFLAAIPLFSQTTFCFLILVSTLLSRRWGGFLGGWGGFVLVPSPIETFASTFNFQPWPFFSLYSTPSHQNRVLSSDTIKIPSQTEAPPLSQLKVPPPSFFFFRLAPLPPQRKTQSQDSTAQPERRPPREEVLLPAKSPKESVAQTFPEKPPSPQTRSSLSTPKVAKRDLKKIATFSQYKRHFPSSFFQEAMWSLSLAIS